MTAYTSKGVATAMTPCLHIKISEDSIPLLQDQPLLAHLYFGDILDYSNDCLSIQTDLEVLGSNSFSQYWFTNQQVQRAEHKDVRYANNQQMLFGHIRLSCENANDFQQLVEQVYEQIFACLTTTGCKHLLRTWNYFPEITKTDAEQQHANRYELFCSGRLHALQKSSIDDKIYPAATVIGNHSDCLQIYFLASDTPGIAVENPRQTSAYHYPVTDSFTQPLFSRGILRVWGNSTHLYVSGTASIVGHETRHINDVSAQLNEAINNVETLVAHVNDQHQTELNAQDDLLYMKVYVRHRNNIAPIKQVLAARLSGTTPRILLLGDMCRDDLLVEIEAFYQA